LKPVVCCVKVFGGIVIPDINLFTKEEFLMNLLRNIKESNRWTNFIFSQIK